MKEYMVFAIFLYLTKHKKTTANKIAQEFEISNRSVYRYIDALSLAGVPITSKIGRGGGLEIIDNIKVESLILSNADKEIIKKYISANGDSELARVLKKII